MNSIQAITINPTRVSLTTKSLPYRADVTVSCFGSSGLGIIWRSENPKIATVDLTTGKITAKRVGKTEIYAFPQDGDYCYAKLTVVVKSRIKVYLKAFIGKLVGKFVFHSKYISEKGG